MTDFPIYKPPPPKPKAGSLPLRDERPVMQPHPAQAGLPPFLSEEPPERGQARSANLGKLRSARRKAEQLGSVVRDDAFDDWVRRSLFEAESPAAWTQASELYQNYMRHAARYGSSRSDRALSRQLVATETRWGKMMGSLFVKTRRAKGWYYPVRLKHGA
jgi:hypothetical protein